MPIIDKMLAIGARWRFLCVLALIISGGFYHDSTLAFLAAAPTVITRVDIYYKDFESTSPVQLDDSSLKTASDISLSTTDRHKIALVKRELDSLPCEVVSTITDVGDLRLLVELSDSDGRVHTWRGSRFYFQNRHGTSVCKLTSSDMGKLEALLSFLKRTALKS